MYTLAYLQGAGRIFHLCIPCISREKEARKVTGEASSKRLRFDGATAAVGGTMVVYSPQPGAPASFASGGALLAGFQSELLSLRSALAASAAAIQPRSTALPSEEPFWQPGGEALFTKDVERLLDQLETRISLAYAEKLPSLKGVELITGEKRMLSLKRVSSPNGVRFIGDEESDVSFLAYLLCDFDGDAEALLAEAIIASEAAHRRNLLAANRSSASANVHHWGGCALMMVDPTSNRFLDGGILHFDAKEGQSFAFTHLHKAPALETIAMQGVTYTLPHVLSLIGIHPDHQAAAIAWSADEHRYDIKELLKNFGMALSRDHDIFAVTGDSAAQLATRGRTNSGGGALLHRTPPHPGQGNSRLLCFHYYSGAMQYDKTVQIHAFHICAYWQAWPAAVFHLWKNLGRSPDAATHWVELPAFKGAVEKVAAKMRAVVVGGVIAEPTEAAQDAYALQLALAWRSSEKLEVTPPWVPKHIAECLDRAASEARAAAAALGAADAEKTTEAAARANRMRTRHNA